MYPWLWFWSPHFYFPFSGSVQQRIEPETDWFFDGIPAQAGNGQVEREIFDIASYGRQIGWITEILLGMNSGDAPTQAKGAKSLDCLRKIQPRIAAAKARGKNSLQTNAANALAQLRAADPVAYDQLLASIPLTAPTQPQPRRISSRSKAS